MLLLLTEALSEGLGSLDARFAVTGVFAEVTVISFALISEVTSSSVSSSSEAASTSTSSSVSVSSEVFSTSSASFFTSFLLFSLNSYCLF